MELWQRAGHNILSAPSQWSRNLQSAANFRWLAEAIARGDKIYMASPPGAEIGTRMYESELMFLQALGYTRQGNFMVGP